MATKKRTRWDSPDSLLSAAQIVKRAASSANAGIRRLAGLSSEDAHALIQGHMDAERACKRKLTRKQEIVLRAVRRNPETARTKAARKATPRKKAAKKTTTRKKAAKKTTTRKKR